MKMKLSVTPNRKELTLGTIYMLLELFVLPYILAAINMLLPNPMSAGKLNVVFFVVNFGITTLIFRDFLKNTIRKAQGRTLIILIGAIRGFILYWLGNIVVTMLVLKLNPEFININDATISVMAEQDFLPLAICSVIFVPITEELLFRGVLFAGFYNRSPWKAFLISIAVFSAIHVMNYVFDASWDVLLLCFLQYIPAGLALGWAYKKSDSILAPILMHMAVNAIGMLAMR